MASQIKTMHQIIEWVRAKKPKAKLLFVDFSMAYYSIHRRKMEQILLTYDISKETVTAILLLYINVRRKFYSVEGDAELFDIVAGVL